MLNSMLSFWNPVSSDPFFLPRRPLWIPNEMLTPPKLGEDKHSEIEPGSILLINPFYPKDPHASFGKHVLTPSLALTSIAAATPNGWEVHFWDENLLMGPPPCQPVPQVVGITVHLTFAKRAYELSSWYRSMGSIVILGGLHALSCPDEVAAHADAIVLGDGVQVWAQVLADVQRGCLQSRYSANYTNEYDEDPQPLRAILPGKSFLTTASMIATRGCHNRCGFCYLSTDGLKMPYRTRDVLDIRRQIESSGEPYAVFVDNNLGSKPEYLRALCRELENLNVIWSAAVSVDVSDDPSLVRAMALAGCTGVFIGFESLRDANLADAHKRTPKASEYAARVRMFHDNGIQVNGSFVVGFDHDDRETFASTAEWIEANRLECATFHILTPYPGTPLFREFEASGRILHRDWSKYDTAHVVFRPKNMSEEELALGYDWMYRRLFTIESIWKRRPEARSAALPYLAMSLLYKKSNWFWHWLITHQLVHAAWSPLVQWTRLRHSIFRQQLRRQQLTEMNIRSRAPISISPGV